MRDTFTVQDLCDFKNYKFTLKELRCRYNLKQSEVAKLLDIPTFTWVQLEKDATNIKLDTAIKISKLFRIPATLIYLGKSNDIKLNKEEKNV
jgi:DNA-binding XRE family transcriptional regulator